MSSKRGVVILIGLYLRRIDKHMRVYLPKRFLAERGDLGYVGLSVHIAIVGHSLEFEFPHVPAILVFFSKTELDDYFAQYEEHTMLTASECSHNSSQYYAQCVVDKRGRVKLPQWLAGKVSIFPQSEVMCVGCGGWIELWNSAEWEKVDIWASFEHEREATTLMKLLGLE